MKSFGKWTLFFTNATQAFLAGSVPPGILEKIAALQLDVELASHQERMKALTQEEESKIVERVWSNKRATRRHIKRMLAKGAMADAVAEVHRLKAARVMLSTLSSSEVKKGPDF